MSRSSSKMMLAGVDGPPPGAYKFNGRNAPLGQAQPSDLALPIPSKSFMNLDEPTSKGNSMSRRRRLFGVIAVAFVLVAAAVGSIAAVFSTRSNAAAGVAPVVTPLAMSANTNNMLVSNVNVDTIIGIFFADLNFDVQFVNSNPFEVTMIDIETSLSFSVLTLSIDFFGQILAPSEGNVTTDAGLSISFDGANFPDIATAVIDLLKGCLGAPGEAPFTVSGNVTAIALGFETSFSIPGFVFAIPCGIDDILGAFLPFFRSNNGTEPVFDESMLADVNITQLLPKGEKVSFGHVILSMAAFDYQQKHPTL